jgi:hypothetical protein
MIHLPCEAKSSHVLFATDSSQQVCFGGLVAREPFKVGDLGGSGSLFVGFCLSSAPSFAIAVDRLTYVVPPPHNATSLHMPGTAKRRGNDISQTVDRNRKRRSTRKAKPHEQRTRTT